MNKTILISSFLVFSLSVACTKDYVPGEMPRDSYGINAFQAELYASMYAPLLSNAENDGDASTKATSGQEKILKDIAYAETDEGTFCQRGVLLSAQNMSGTGGHTWFCDGYYEQHYEVVEKFLGFVIDKWDEYDDRLYMNWGGGPNGGNGWYCATDNVWTSIEGNEDKNYKLNTHMYINLGYYEIPE